ncbi:ABC transporter substrate-binding protein [Paenibacillus antibioticophila]|uniref:ABC transporter substrate-binding protein n=1 Tax=Paenibacillus antibioticophila TaxID=1274374 RepID=UPI000AFE7F4D|nr:ABC transporter substrate-binding protein [Paenibacillus antibioticophila]
MTLALSGCESGNISNDVKNSTNSNETKPVASEGATSGEIDFNEEPYTIKVNYAVLGQEQPDLPKIEAKLNELTLKKINAKVDLEGVSLYNMANVYSLKSSSREKMDLMLMMPGDTYLSKFANNKMIRPIDKELAEWGPALQKTVGYMLPVGQFKGEQYAIPQKFATLTNGFNMNKAILDKYKIEISNNIKTLDEMDLIFAKVHKNEPNMTILAPEVVSSSIAGILMKFDGLGNLYGGLMNGEGTKITNLFEEEEFVNTVKKVREWFEKGYISKDVSTSQEDGGTLLDNGKVFATAAGSVNFIYGGSIPIAKKSVALHAPVRFTSNSQLFLWAVASSSERPDKAVQLLNLFNSDEEVATLLQYGIEGVHYEMKANGTVDTSKNSNYQNYWLMFGDRDIKPLGASEVDASGFTPEEYRAKESEWEKSIRASEGYGFFFDYSPVKTEVAALDAVVNQYYKVIGNGSVNPDELLKKFNDTLYDAGLQKVMDEKQRQFDEWRTAQGK